MTSIGSDASPLPSKNTALKRVDRRIWIAAVTILVGGGILILAIYLGVPVRTGGPLEAQEGITFGPIKYEKGDTITLGYTIANELLASPVVLESIELLGEADGVAILGTGYVDCTQKLRLCSPIHRRWPVGDPAMTSIAGTKVGTDGNVWGLIAIRVSHEGLIEFPGARLFYRDGNRRHAADITIRHILEVTSS